MALVADDGGNPREELLPDSLRPPISEGDRTVGRVESQHTPTSRDRRAVTFSEAADSSDQDDERDMNNAALTRSRLESLEDLETDDRMSRRSSMVEAPSLRVHEVRVSTFTEYFFDILYVMPLQNLFLVQFGSLDFCVFFFATFNSWLGESFYNSRFDTDDAASRAMQVLSMLAVAGMSFGLVVDSVTEGGATFMLSYAFMRTLLVLRYVRAWFSVPEARRLIGSLAGGFGFAAALWIFAALAEGPARPVAAIIALLVDYGTPFASVPWMVHVNRTHMADRFAGITTLVSAGSLFALLMGGPQRMPIIYFGGRGGRPLMFPVEQVVVWLLAVCTPVTMLLLYSHVIGMVNKGFTTSMAVRYRAYAYMYAHTLLAFSIEGASCAIASIDCSGDFCAFGEGKLVQMLACWGAVLLVIGLLHILGDHGGDSRRLQNWKRRAAARIFFGTVLIGTAVALIGKTKSLGVLGGFGLVDTLGILQVLLDYLPVMNFHSVRHFLSPRPSLMSDNGSRVESGVPDDERDMNNGASLQPIAGGASSA